METQVSCEYAALPSQGALIIAGSGVWSFPFYGMNTRSQGVHLRIVDMIDSLLIRCEFVLV
jgi:hypothetical protein